MKIDAKEIIDALRLFFQKGDVFEIRVLDAITRRGENGYIIRPHVESGYFDYDHIDTIPQSLEHIISAKGVYFTPNPVNSMLLAKCANRIQQANTGDTTKDCNIVQRRWLLIDFDVDHPGVTGVSSSEEEHNEALRVSDSVKDQLYYNDWPLPVQIDTGNGANLMYSVEMGTSDEDQQIVSDILLALQDLNTKTVKIDPSVKNLARLWRLPGTMNCKGDDIPERPHRMCRIWKKPPDDMFYILNRENMIKISTYGAGKRLASNAAPVNQPTTLSDGVQSFNIEEWIRKYCPECGEPVVTNESKKWFFSVCPWGASHSSPQGAKDTYIAQMPSGAVCFKCSHAHCAGRDWHALRDLKEPDWRTKNIPAADQNVNIDGIVNQKIWATPDELSADDVRRIDNEEAKKDAPWRSVTDQDVRNAIDGTLLGKLNEIYANVTVPKLPIAASLLKSIVTLGCCISGEATDDELERRFNGNLGPAYLSGVDRAKLIINTGGGAFCNFYAILVGNSNSGKDIGRLIEAFANFPNPSAKPDNDEDALNYLVGTSGSAEGIADSLMRKPNGLLIISELQNWLDEKHWMHNAMTFLTDAWDKGYFDYALSRRGGGRKRMTLYCSPSAIANVQPDIFQRFAKKTLIESGNFGRWLIACMPNKEGERFYGSPNNFDRGDALTRIKAITDIYLRKKGIIDIPQGYSSDLKKMFANKTEPIMDATWGRLINQYYPRLAILLSVTEDESTQGEEVVITDDTWTRARTLVMWFFANAERTLRKVKDDDESAFAKDWENSLKKICKTVCRYYKKSGKPVSRKAIAQANVRYSGGNFSANQRKALLEELVYRGILKMKGNAFEPDNIPEDWEI